VIQVQERAKRSRSSSKSSEDPKVQPGRTKLHVLRERPGEGAATPQRSRGCTIRRGSRRAAADGRLVPPSRQRLFGDALLELVVRARGIVPGIRSGVARAARAAAGTRSAPIRSIIPIGALVPRAIGAG
jgi:hypothetical protein